MKKLLSLILILTIFVSGVFSASALTVGDETYNVYNIDESNKNMEWYFDYLKTLKQQRGTTYSSAELKKIESQIRYYIDNKNSIEFSDKYTQLMVRDIVSVSVRDDEEYNCVEVVMNGVNPVRTELFREHISDSDAIIIWEEGGDYSVDFKVDSSAPVATRMKMKSGQTKTIPVANKSNVKLWKSSNPNAIAVKSGRITARQKGSATITAVYGSAIEVRFKYTVEDSPKLTLNGKKVTTIKVKKGKTKKLKLTGKATEYNNKYTNTKRAKFTSKKTSKTIIIRGLKKGTTTLKVLVNKVKTLKIKVKVTK